MSTSLGRAGSGTKGKTVLLLALLQGLGIEAEPALVNTAGGDGLDERLPMLAVFDHVLVRATIAGRVYWLDGTRPKDLDIDSLPTPFFHWALPVRASGAKLERMVPEPLAQPNQDQAMRIDASAGIDVPAIVHLDYTYRGDAAVGMRTLLSTAARTDVDRFLRNFLSSTYPWVTPTKVDFTTDDRQGLVHLILDGMGKMDWYADGSWRSFNITASNLGGETSYRREPGPNQDAPFAVGFPNYQRWTVDIVLPNKGDGYRSGGGADVDATIAGVAYKRVSRIDNGVMHMEASSRSLAPEFPFAEADSAATALRNLSRFYVIVRAPTGAQVTAGAPVFASSNSAEPTDAAGFSQRAATAMSTRQYDRAVADYTRAVELAPTVSKYFYNWGAAHYALGHDDLALADFDKTLSLKDDDVLALMARAELYLNQKHDPVRAKKDSDRALSLAPENTNYTQRMARDYMMAHDYQTSVAYLDQWIEHNPHAANLYGMLADRCLTKARWGKDMESGLADCDASLKLRPDAAGGLNFRGFAELRLGRLDAAIADYDAALRLEPKQSPALYGRGLAKLRKGLKMEGDADIAAAIAQTPKVADNFTPYDLKP